MSVSVEGGATGAGKLLNNLHGLKNLAYLEMEIISPMPPASPDYAALTASSKLESLRLWDWRLPESVWQHVFTPQQHLPCLEVLYTRDLWTEGSDPQITPRWTLLDLSNVVGCCPALEELDISLQAGSHSVSVLGQLSALTCLGAWYTAENADAMAGSIQAMVALTNLESLQLTVDGGSVELTTLLPLTGLRQLRSISCCCQPIADDDSEVLRVAVHNKVSCCNRL